MNSQYQAVEEQLIRCNERPGKIWPWQIAIHVLYLSWLGPIVSLLYLAFPSTS